MRNQQDEKRSRHPEIMRMVTSRAVRRPEVAEQTGVSVQYGAICVGQRRNGHRWPDSPDMIRIDYLPQLRALASEGKTMVQIASAIGKSWQAIRHSATTLR